LEITLKVRLLPLLLQYNKEESAVFRLNVRMILKP